MNPSAMVKEENVDWYEGMKKDGTKIKAQCDDLRLNIPTRICSRGLEPIHS